MYMYTQNNVDIRFDHTVYVLMKSQPLVLLGFPCKLMNHFSFAALKIFSLSLASSIFNMMFLFVHFFMFILLGVLSFLDVSVNKFQ